MEGSPTNWFERNATKSVITYTLLVISATAAATYFVIDQRKVETMQARISFLEEQNRKLERENSTYLEWLRQAPGSLHGLMAENRRLSAENRTLVRSSAKTTAAPGKAASHYVYGRDIAKGEAFVDELTGASLAVSDIRFDGTGTVSVSLPDLPSSFHKNVHAGASWHFHYKGKEYRLLLARLQYVRDEVRAEVREMVR